MNGDAAAAVGTDGVANGSPVAAEDREGVPGRAVAFDGVDDYFDVGHLGTLAAGSMSAWVRLGSLDDNQGVVAAGARGSGNQVYFSLQADVKSRVTLWRCDLDDGATRRRRQDIERRRRTCIEGQLVDGETR